MRRPPLIWRSSQRKVSNRSRSVSSGWASKRSAEDVTPRKPGQQIAHRSCTWLDQSNRNCGVKPSETIGDFLVERSVGHSEVFVAAPGKNDYFLSGGLSGYH